MVVAHFPALYKLLIRNVQHREWRFLIEAGHLKLRSGSKISLPSDTKRHLKFLIELRSGVFTFAFIGALPFPGGLPACICGRVR